MSTEADRSPSWEEDRTSAVVSGTAIDGLTDDLNVEILSRVPIKSLCRFKCVSKHWLGLIDHPDHRKKLPQTLAGFFHTCTDGEQPPKSTLRFVNVSGRRCPPVDVSLSFLPNHRRVEFLDCCNGLLLCRSYSYHASGVEWCYVVCNPATEQWVALPDPSHVCTAAKPCLGFDPAVSSNFYVFVLLEDINFYLAGVDVYSSETRRWAHKDSGWNEDLTLFGLPSATVFLNGCLHFHADGSMSSLCLAAVDAKGETWTIFGTPSDLPTDFLQQSHGCLHYSNFERDEDGAVVGLVVYVLKDYVNKEWILKHSVDNSHVSGEINFSGYRWIVIHPQCDSLFFTEGWATRFVCYNMDRQQIKVISNLEYGDPPYLPYVPLYAELQSLHT